MTIVVDIISDNTYLKFYYYSESTLLDTGTSDHVVAMHQLKDQIAQLKKQLQVKDNQMLAREKQVSSIMFVLN